MDEITQDKIMKEPPKYVVRQENEDIILRPGKLLNTDAPTGINITPVTLSRMGTTKLWFLEFLKGTENNPDNWEVEGKKYYAFRDSGNIYLEEKRDNIASIVGFTSGEFQKVFEEYQQVFNMEESVT